MSREDINLTGKVTVAELVADDPELQDYMIRQVQVLDRVSTRFKIDGAPEDIHYEWHPQDPETHARLTEKGFILNNELGAKSNYSHTDGAGNAKIADVVCYSIPKKKYTILQAIEHEKSLRRTDPRRATKDFEKTVSESQIPGLEVTQAETTSQIILNNEIKKILDTEKSSG